MADVSTSEEDDDEDQYEDEDDDETAQWPVLAAPLFASQSSNLLTPSYSPVVPTKLSRSQSLGLDHQEGAPETLLSNIDTAVAPPAPEAYPHFRRASLSAPPPELDSHRYSAAALLKRIAPVRGGLGASDPVPEEDDEEEPYLRELSSYVHQRAGSDAFVPQAEHQLPVFRRYSQFVGDDYYGYPPPRPTPQFSYDAYSENASSFDPSAAAAPNYAQYQTNPARQFANYQMGHQPAPVPHSYIISPAPASMSTQLGPHHFAQFSQFAPPRAYLSPSSYPAETHAQAQKHAEDKSDSAMSDEFEAEELMTVEEEKSRGQIDELAVIAAADIEVESSERVLPKPRPSKLVIAPLAPSVLVNQGAGATIPSMISLDSPLSATFKIQPPPHLAQSTLATPEMIEADQRYLLQQEQYVKYEQQRQQQREQLDRQEQQQLLLWQDQSDKYQQLQYQHQYQQQQQQEYYIQLQLQQQYQFEQQQQRMFLEQQQFQYSEVYHLRHTSSISGYAGAPPF